MLSWCHGWAATIWSHSPNDRVECDFRRFAEMLPISIRDSYCKVIPRMRLGLKPLWNTAPKFIDGIYSDSPEKDVSLLPLSHYMRLICSNFMSFNANAHFFDGARPEWPFVEKQLGYVDGATLVDVNGTLP